MTKSTHKSPVVNTDAVPAADTDAVPAAATALPRRHQPHLKSGPALRQMAASIVPPSRSTIV